MMAMAAKAMSLSVAWRDQEHLTTGKDVNHLVLSAQDKTNQRQQRRRRVNELDAYPPRAEKITKLICQTFFR